MLEKLNISEYVEMWWAGLPETGRTQAVCTATRQDVLVFFREKLF